MTIIGFAFGASLTFLLLAVGHWFPWPKRLTRIQAYIYGVTSIAVGFTLWRLLVGDWLTTVGLWLMAVGGGVVVIAAYWIDDKIDEFTEQARKAEKAERLIHDRIPKP